MPQVRHQDGSKYQKLKLLFMFGTLLLMAGGIVLFFWYFGMGMSAEQFDEKIRQTEAMAGRREYTLEATTLNDLYKRSFTAERKQVIILRLAAAYANAKDYDNSIASYQKAIDTYPDMKMGGIRGMAFVYMTRGQESNNVDDLRKSQSYFEQALEIEKLDQRYKTYIQNEESNIAYVKGLIRNASE